MTAFLIQYNRRTAESIVTEFVGPDGRSQAMRERLALEKSRSDRDIEIVTLSGDTLDTIKRTHSRYFQGIVRELTPC
ncbi:hypothetical protein [Rhodococcus sp. (in: high G+C Gram-positive bacteria)]|uniref:hypothetical protein n=1 Tax=Rhodococcus sp. TaxID=1831 RepID=UPI001A1B82E6|nr:hypothetical protein [Rhodococcus sp. (in: high G+C Gram-positive bacteria)]MBJ7479284.1 hypothetical protein [Rhodococcus sp. (in: high G+C Gram-positive bacteria)]